MTVLLRDIPTLDLWHPKLIYAMTGRLDGFIPVPDGIIRLGGVTLRR